MRRCTSENMNMGLRFVDSNFAKELVFCFVSVSVGDPGVYVGFCEFQNLHFKFTFRDTHKNNRDIHPGVCFPGGLEEADENPFSFVLFLKLDVGGTECPGLPHKLGVCPAECAPLRRYVGAGYTTHAESGVFGV